MKKKKKTKKKLKYLSKRNLPISKLIASFVVIAAIILAIISNFGASSP
jgi:hypothetical protein